MRFAGFSARPIDNPYPFAVQANPAGGYNRAEPYNPNSAMNVYKMQTGAKTGQHTAPQFGNQPAFQNTLGENIDLQSRAGAHDQAVNDQERIERRHGSMQNPYLKDKRWSALFQALSEAGADNLRTGARAGWEQPGFFDTQATTGAQSQGRADLLQAMLMNEGRVNDSRFVRGLR